MNTTATHLIRCFACLALVLGGCRSTTSGGNCPDQTDCTCPDGTNGELFCDVDRDFAYCICGAGVGDVGVGDVNVVSDAARDADESDTDAGVADADDAAPMDAAADTTEDADAADADPEDADVAPDVLADAAGDSDVSDTSDTDASPDVTSDVADASLDTDTMPDAAPTCDLTPSGPVASTMDGQVIENLHIVTTGEAGIIVRHDGVVVRNVFVEHTFAEGIVVDHADGVTLEDVDVVHTGAPASGANDSAERLNIACRGSASLTVTRARLTRGSSGIYLVGCDDSVLTYIEGHDFRGPFPRGQVVQWNSSDDGLLEHFSVENPVGSWPEDDVNAYQSQRVTIRDGLVDGNNAPSGVGVIFDRDSTGLVEDVDAIHMGNGCFSAIAGGADATFRRTRCTETICESQEGRGDPRSGSLVWAGNPALTGAHVIEDSVYFALCTNNPVWPRDSFASVDIREEAFVPRDPIRLSFCWE